MSRAQQYVQTLMENVAEGQISSDQYRLMFGKIGRRLAQADDFDTELRRLYKVAGFSEFALSLMWIAERVEADPGKTEFTPNEQALVVQRYRYAIGDLEQPPLGEPAADLPADDAVFAPAAEATQGGTEETPEMPAVLQMETSGAIAASEQSTYAPPPGSAEGSEGEYAALMEKFVEAMQSGSEERDGLLKEVVERSNAFKAEGSGMAADVREFCGYLVEFLQYINENGFMDDVRVMNILSNVSSPVASWAQAAPENRSGQLSEGTEILRTFKSLFE